MIRFIKKISKQLVKKPASNFYGYYQKYKFNRLFCKFNDTYHFSNMYEFCQEKIELKTDKEIKFFNSIPFGSTIKEIKNKLGTPYFHIQKKEHFNLEVSMYRIKIGNQKVKCKLYFYEKKLFLFNYSFSYANNFEIEEIIKIIQKKYIPNKSTFTNQIIKDSKNNCIFIDNSLEFAINYTTLDCPIYEKSVRKYREINEQISRKEVALDLAFYARI